MASSEDIVMIRLPWLENFIFYNFLITTFVIPISVSLNEIFTVLTIISWVIKLIVRRERINVPPLGWFFSIFLLAAILSAIASDYRFEALRGVWDVTRYTFTFFIVIDIIKSPNQAQKVIWTLIVSTGIWVIMGVVHQFLILKRELFYLLKFFALGNKNAIGQYLQMMLSIMVGLFINISLDSKKRIVLIAVIFISLLGLFLSSSKTMWVAFILTLLIFSYLKRSRKILMGAGFVVFAFMVAFSVNDQVRHMGLNILKGLEAPSMQERYIGWKQSYYMFIDNPIFGVGPKCFMDAREKYRVPSSFGQAHNLVFHTACEMGIVGVASLFSWIVFYVYFIMTYRKRVKDPVYLGLWFGGVGYLVTLAIGGMTEPTIGGEHSQLFMILIGLMHVGLESDGKECQKSITQEAIV
jgi:O-antigen ligase